MDEEHFTPGTFRYFIRDYLISHEFYTIRANVMLPLSGARKSKLALKGGITYSTMPPFKNFTSTVIRAPIFLPYPKALFSKDTKLISPFFSNFLIEAAFPFYKEIEVEFLPFYFLPFRRITRKDGSVLPQLTSSSFKDHITGMTLKFSYKLLGIPTALYISGIFPTDITQKPFSFQTHLYFIVGYSNFTPFTY